MAGVGASTSNSSSGTSATSDDDHDSDVLMANNTISVCINKRHKTYMQACCADGICFGKFKDIETRILAADPQPLFSNIHINKNGVCVPSVPRDFINTCFSSTNMSKSVWMSGFWKPLVHKNMSNFWNNIFYKIRWQGKSDRIFETA